MSVCPTGQAPKGAYKVCTVCKTATFADHEAHECVATCPVGTTADDSTNDCVDTAPTGSPTTAAPTVAGDTVELGQAAPATAPAPDAPPGAPPGGEGSDGSDPSEAPPEGQDNPPDGQVMPPAPEKLGETAPAPAPALAPAPAPEPAPAQEEEEEAPARAPAQEEEAPAPALPGTTCEGNDDGEYCLSACDGNKPSCATQCGAGAAAKGGNGDDAYDCEPCGNTAPYADHDAHQCVENCPAGSAPNEVKDCAACADNKYADHATNKCVETCGTGFAGSFASSAYSSLSFCFSAGLDRPYLCSACFHFVSVGCLYYSNHTID